MDLHARFATLPSELQQRVSQALDIIYSAFDEFGLAHLAFSFNGGKDSMVLLHLIRAALAKHLLETTGRPPTPDNELHHITFVYFDGGDNFPEMAQFIDDINRRYRINLSVRSDSIQHGLQVLLEQRPDLKGIFQGVRRTDPYSERLSVFQMTDPSWPQIVRISPILDWSYDDVWRFLRLLGLQWCSLYELGYTSIGSRSDTVPNPALLRRVPEGDVGGSRSVTGADPLDAEALRRAYAPAWELKDGRLERDSRVSRK